MNEQNLTENQLRASQLEGPVVVLAGAGTGKTRTLVAAVLDRITRRHVDPGNILAVTFTNKAAREMKMRLAKELQEQRAPRWVGTFHSHGYAQIRRFPEIASLESGPKIANERQAREILYEQLETHKNDRNFPDLINRNNGHTSVSEEIASYVYGCVVEFKEHLIEPHEAQNYVAQLLESEGNGNEGSFSGSLYNRVWWAAAAIYPHYQEALRKKNLADFSDLLLWPTLEMARNEPFRKYWAKIFQYVLVDEFQDVNYIQYLWLQLIMRGNNEIFVVGDDAQSIYGFRGAKVEYIRQFENDFPGAVIISLEENFRSTQNILTAANTIIRPDGVNKTLFTKAEDGEKISVMEFPDAEKEAKAVVQQIFFLKCRKENLNEIAILYRNNSLSRLFEEALRAAHIPYEMVKDFSFWRREVVKDAIALLEVYLYPDDPRSNESLCRIINKPARGAGPKKFEEILALADEEKLTFFQAAERYCSRKKTKTNDKLAEFLSVLRTYKPENPDAHIYFILSELLDLIGYRAMCAKKLDRGVDDLANIGELINVVKEYNDAEAFFQHVALGYLPDSEHRNSVKLMTIHASKGMEFKNVFLVAWEAQIIPSPKSEIPNEERRLAYVGITRAEKKLAITWCNSRYEKSHDPSRFIFELPDEVIQNQWWK